jgi:hypothetical protein
MQPLDQALAHWHEFYMLLGTAAGTLVGLLFVAASVGSGVFSPDRQAPLRVFLSASVVHFGSVLVMSLLVLAPITSWVLFGGFVIACGLLGLGYYGMALFDAWRDGLLANLPWDDRVRYAALPIVAYAVETAAGIVLVVHGDGGDVALAASLLGLLVVGVHNAWDITVWTMTRRRE